MRSKHDFLRFAFASIIILIFGGIAVAMIAVAAIAFCYAFLLTPSSQAVFQNATIGV